MVRADPALGSARLLDDALARLSQRRPTVELLAGGFDVPGSRGAFAQVDGRRFADPELLVASMQERLSSGRTLVLSLADLDLALPPVRWIDLFLLRSLPPLLRAQRLVVLATVSRSGGLGAESDGAAVIAELERLGLAQIVELDRYRRDEVVDALEGADEAVAEDLSTLGDGDPDRIATLFERWEDARVVTREGRSWVYASEREAARGRSGIDIRRELLLSFTPPEDPASVAGYERAVATLGVAALEGMVFTVAALAACSTRTRRSSATGSTTTSSSTPTIHTRRSTASGSSRSRGRLALSLRLPRPPALGRAAADTQPPHGTPLRRSPRDRLRPLLDRGDRPDLGPGQLAGDDQELYFSSVANVFATVQDHLRVLEAEAATPEDGDPRAAIASVRRLVRHMAAAGPALDADARLRYAELARSRLQTAENVLPDDRRARAWIDVYEGLATAARALGWYADGVRCDALSLALEKDPVAASRRALSVAERLLELIARDAVGESHLELPPTWLDDGSGTIATHAIGLHRSATTVIEGLPEEVRSHDEAHLRHTGALLAALAGDWGTAVENETKTLALLDLQPEGSCNLRVLTYLSLANHLEAAGDREAAITAARNAVARRQRSEPAEEQLGLEILEHLAREVTRPVTGGVDKLPVRNFFDATRPRAGPAASMVVPMDAPFTLEPGADGSAS